MFPRLLDSTVPKSRASSPDGIRPSRWSAAFKRIAPPSEAPLRRRRSRKHRAGAACRQAHDEGAAAVEAQREDGHVYGVCRYGAGSWSRKRRVVIKAEVVRLEGREPKDNPRFVVTNLPDRPQAIYEDVYCQRGDVENRIKELHHGLEIDRTSCTRFWANQLRGLMTAAAYVLMQELRHHGAQGHR